MPWPTRERLGSHCFTIDAEVCLTDSGPNARLTMAASGTLFSDVGKVPLQVVLDQPKGAEVDLGSSL